MLIEMRSMGIKLETTDSGALLAAFHVRPVLVDHVVSNSALGLLNGHGILPIYENLLL